MYSKQLQYQSVQIYVTPMGFYKITRVQTKLKISNLLVCIYRCIYELETNIMGKPFKDLFFKKYFISPGSDVLENL